MEKKKHNKLLKRVFAIALALMTLVSTTGINKGLIAAPGVYSIEKGNTISQEFKSNAPNGGSSTLNSVKIKVDESLNDKSFNLTYKVEFKSATDSESIYESPISHAQEYTVENGFITLPIEKVKLAENELFKVTITNNSDEKLLIKGYDEAGSASVNGGVTNDTLIKETLSTSNELPDDVTSIKLSSDKKAIAVGEKIELETELNEEVNGRKRDIKYESTKDCAQVNGNVVEGVKAGVTTIKATYGSKTSNDITLYVVDAKLKDSTNYVYNGNPIIPELEVNADNALTKVTESNQNGYNITLSDNVDAGSKTLTVKGVGIYSGFEKIIPFKIEQAEITKAEVDSSKITVSSRGDVSVTDLYVKGVKLQQGKDFVAKASDPKYTSSKCSYKVTIEGIKNYKGSVEKTDRVESDYSKGNLIDISYVFRAEIDGNYEYTGKDIIPTIKLFYISSGDEVTGTEKEKIFQEDIDVTYQDNRNAGKAKAILTGKGNKYTGNIKLDYTIHKRNIVKSLNNKELSLIGLNSNYQKSGTEENEYLLDTKFVYTGEDIVFKDLALNMEYVKGSGTTTLNKKTDYEVSYQNNKYISDSAPIMKIEGKGNYTGTLVFHYKIIPDFVRQLKITIEGTEYQVKTSDVLSDFSSKVVTNCKKQYDGTEKKIDQIEVTLDGKKLKENEDYSKEYKNNINAGTATITLKGLKNYVGKNVDVEYKITPKDISEGRIEIKGDHTYNGGIEVKPVDADIEVHDKNGNIISNTPTKNYEVVKYQNNKDTGKATVEIKGVGNYTGSLKGTYNIKPLDIKDAKINPKDSDNSGIIVRFKAVHAYTGKKIVPEVVIYKDNVKVADSIDKDLNKNIEIKCQNNKKVSKSAKIIIKGKNNLTGEINSTFEIAKRKFDNIEIKIGGKDAVKDSSTPDKYISDYEEIYTYGSTNVPVLEVKDNSNDRLLTAGSDYYIIRSSTDASNSAYITIQGQGNYDGSKADVYFKIKPREISDKNIVVEQDGFKKNSNCPKFTIKDNNGYPHELKAADDKNKKDAEYEIIPVDKSGKKIKDFGNKPGKYYVKVKGLNNYTGERELISYEKGKSLENTKITLVNPGNKDIVYGTYETNPIEIPYIGKHRPKINIYDNSKGTDELIKDLNYTISYDKNDDSSYNAGQTVKVKILAKDDSKDYYGAKEISYTIKQLTFVTRDGIASVYDDGDSKIPVNYFAGNQGVILVSDGNQTSDRKDMVKGVRFGYYYAHQGEKDGYKKLIPNAVIKYYPLGKNHDAIILSTDDFTYSKDEINVNALNTERKVDITIGGKGNYTDTFNIGYKIDKSDISNSEASGFKKYDSGTLKGALHSVYDGNPIDISAVNLNLYGANLTENIDYTMDTTFMYKSSDGGSEVSVTEIKEPGIYTIKYIGKGPNYTGEKKLQFEVTAKEFNEDIYKVDGKKVFKYTTKEISLPKYVLKEKDKVLSNDNYDFSLYSGDQTKTKDFTTLTKIEPKKIKDIGIYTLVFTGKGKYKGTICKKIKVVGDISDEKIFTVKSNLTGTYSEDNLNTKVDEISITYNDGSVDKILSKDTDYEVDKTEWKGPNSSKVILKGKSKDKEGKKYLDDNLFIGKVTINNEMKGDITSATLIDKQSGMDNVYPYTGKDIKPELDVEVDGKKLILDKDYKIVYPNNPSSLKDVGEYKYYIQGINDYTGEAFRTDIQTYYVKYNLSNVKVSFNDGKNNIPSNKFKKSINTDDLEQNKVKPIVELKLSNNKTITLSETDYTLTYSNYKNIGTVQVTIEPNSITNTSYNKKVVSYELKGKELNNDNTKVTIKGKDIDSYSEDFTGSQIGNFSDVKVLYSSKNIELNEGVDYDISYGENINSGDGILTITGKGGYSGKVDKKFKINPIKLSDKNDKDLNKNLKFEITENPIYAGQKVIVKPKFTIALGNYTLKEGEDFEVTVGEPTENNKKEVEETLTIKGKKNFYGNYITKVKLSDRDITVDGSIDVDTEKVYDGEKVNVDDVKVKVDLGIKDNNGDKVVTTLNKGKDYDIVPVNPNDLHADVGSYSFTITAKAGSHFTGQKIITVSIVPKDIKDDDVSMTLDKVDFDYTGEEVTPNEISGVYTVKAKKKGAKDTKLGMKINKDFTLSYQNNIASASKDDKDNAPTVVVTGNGNYTGEKHVHFNIGKDLKDAAKIIDYEDPEFIYDGQEHGENDLKYKVVLKKGDHDELIRGNDYSVVEIKDTGKNDIYFDTNDIIHAGEKTLTLKGEGGYYGTLDIIYHIKAKEVVNKDEQKSNIRVVFKDFNYNEETKEYETDYNGERQTSDIEIYDDDIDSTTPIDKNNYELYMEGDYKEGKGYANNKNVSTTDSKASVCIKLKGDYSNGRDTLVRTFNIKGKSIETFNVELQSAINSIKDAVKDNNSDKYPYDEDTKKPIVPGLLFRDGADELKLRRGIDYDITLYNNDKIGEAKIIINGKGNYSGKITKNFIIYANLENAKVTLTDDSYYYIGSGNIPNPIGKDKIKSIKVGGVTLDPEDYVVSESSANNYQTSGNLIIEPNEKGPRYKYLSRIAQKEYIITSDLGKLKVIDKNNPDFPDYEYTGKSIVPDFIIETPNKNKLSYDKDAVVFYKVNKNKEEKVDRLIDKGNYRAVIPLFTGSKGSRELKVNFNITNEKIRKSNILYVRRYLYTGKAEQPNLSVVKNNKYLKEGRDYEVKVVDFKGEKTELKEIGTYYLVIKGLGKYKDSYVDYRLLKESVTVCPNTLSLLAVKNKSSNYIMVEWNKSPNVTGYKLRVKEQGSSDFKEYKVKGDSYSLTGLKPETSYEIELIPYLFNRDEQKEYYGNSSNIIVKTNVKELNVPSRPNGSNHSSGGSARGNEITWDKDDASVDGYDIFRSSKRDGKYRIIARVSRNYGRYIDKRAKSGKTYYYKMRSFKAMPDRRIIKSELSDYIIIRTK